MQSSKTNQQARSQQNEKQIEFEQYKIFNEIKNSQHIEINQYFTIMAILASNLKLSIYDAITRNQIAEINIQDYVKIENSLKQSPYYKCGDVMMRFLKNTNYLGVYLKNYGDFLIIKICEPENTKPVYRLQLQDKLSFIEMDPFNKNYFIFGQKSIELGNIKTQKLISIEEGQSVEVQIVNSNDNLNEDSQSDQTQSEDGETKFPKSVSSNIQFKMNVEDSVKEDDFQIGTEQSNVQMKKIGVPNSKVISQQQNEQLLDQEMDEEDDEDNMPQDIEDNEDDEQSQEIDEDEEVENFEDPNISAQLLPEDDNIEDEKKPRKKGNFLSNNNLSYKKKQSSKKGPYKYKSKGHEKNNNGIQSGTNISINNSTNNNNNDGMNGEVETKLLDSNSYAIYLKQRCSKHKKTILGFVNRQIVIYEITINEDKQIQIQLINRLEFNELHEYDMSFVQMATNLQNDKFTLVLDKKFMHIFGLNSNNQIVTFGEEYLSQDQTKRYMNPLFWRDPYDKERPEYFVYLDNTHLNCSICFVNLRTAKRQIVILQADKPKNLIFNVRWEGCLCVIGEGGSIFILECPKCYYWENFSYRFKGLEKNSQYIEKEDEFDVKDDNFDIKPLTEFEFDNLKTHYSDLLYPAIDKIMIDGTYDYRENNE